MEIRFYLTSLYELVKLEVTSETDHHTEAQISELRELFNKCQTWKGNKCKLTVQQWPFIPKFLREYQITKDYIPIDEPEVIKKKLATSKKVSCRFGCDCNDIDKLGPYEPSNQKWKTNCPARSQRVECTQSTCANVGCQNRNIGSFRRKILGVDIEERFTWGVDTWTKNHIFYCLPGNDLESRHTFLSRTLQLAIN